MAIEDETETSKSSSESVLTHLTEIIVNILLRLPVDSLLRCKSVCKTWCSLISDPQFVKSHLSLILSSNSDYANERLMFSIRRAIIKTCGVNDVVYDNSVSKALELDYPLKDPRKFVEIVGSCNGLLCLAIEKEAMVIMNPSTRKSTIIPDCAKRSECGRHVWYGFGYEELSDDYKLVEICVLFEDTYSGTCIRICSLKSGIWNVVGAFPFLHPLMEPGKFSNGALHWFFQNPIKNPRSYISWNIFSVDLAKETYGEVSQPDYDEGERDCTLGTLKERLCVLCSYYGIRADVWVMKVYGVKDSWTKLVSIPYLSHTRMGQFSVPLCIFNDGKIVLLSGSKLTLYDSKNGSFSEIQKNCECMQVSTFVESLVSPPMPASGPGDRS